MAATTLHTSPLEALHSSDELGLLDGIDSLRSQGISHYVSLPQLIVCGDQSSGKSSVLNAISGVPFPTKDNLCTRFATELILRRTSVANVSVGIVPSQTRSEADRKRLAGFRESLATFGDFPSLLEAATEAMGIAPNSAFSNDVLRVEISGPDRPHLTIVDLPGLIHSENRLQSEADVKLVRELVKSYMSNRRSIILAIVSAKNDYANQIVLKMAKFVDHKGMRTMGIITKPDTLPVGSESELGFANLARNEDVEFRLGWHVLRNRDYESRNASVEARDLAEQEFFAQGIWQDFPRELVGITALRGRLSKVLLEQIKNELPSLVKEIENTIQDCTIKLKKLGANRATLDEQRLFLLDVSQSFQSLVKAAADGTYGDAFFGDARSDEGSRKRLRAVIQNFNQDFAEAMRTRGHRQQIVDKVARSKRYFPLGEPQPIAKADFINDIRDLLKRNRGRELPGMFNPLVVADLFHDQAIPWDGIARQHVKDCLQAAVEFLDLSVAYLTDATTSEALLKEVVDPQLEKITKHLDEKLIDLLACYQKGHPITYNHYFTETIQNVREKRLEGEVSKKLQKFFGLEENDPLEDSPMKKIRLPSLISALSMRNEADMDNFACAELLDCMEAYYKVAMKVVVDNIAIQGIENVLMTGLRGILSPSSVVQMKPELVRTIAGESQENQNLRGHLTRKLEVLRSGADICKRYMGRSLSAIQNHTPEKSDLGQNSPFPQASEDGHWHRDSTSSRSSSRSGSNRKEDQEISSRQGRTFPPRPTSPPEPYVIEEACPPLEPSMVDEVPRAEEIRGFDTISTSFAPTNNGWEIPPEPDDATLSPVAEKPISKKKKSKKSRNYDLPKSSFPEDS